MEEFLRRIRGLAGVREAGATTTLPLQGQWISGLLSEGQEYDQDADLPFTHMIPVSSGDFGAMGIQLLGGRDPAPEYLTEGALGVVVNETFASQRWHGESALGKRIRANAPSDSWLEAVVVGVVGDVRQNGLENPPEEGMYLPFFPSFQPTRWVAAGVCLGLVAVTAATVPALRASRADPVDVMRAE